MVAGEKSPIFHDCVTENYSPMLIHLKHLGYKDKIALNLCAHRSCDFENYENGENVFPELIIDFIESVEKK